MFRKRRTYFAALLLCSVFSSGTVFSQAEPKALFLTWQDDPTSTMVIDWHLSRHEIPDSLYYRKFGETHWNSAYPLQKAFPYSDRNLYRVNLGSLTPDCRYDFRIGKSGRKYWFETMPGNITDRAVVFAIGGDTYDRGHDARDMWMERTNRIVMEYNPRFIVWGGDLAYADGKKDQVWRWYGWFEAIKNTLIREDGKVIPIIVCIGNHEVNTSYSEWGDAYEGSDVQRSRSAPFFYSLFSFPGQPGYNALDFGDYLSLIILDSEHTNPVSGNQSKWLEKTLAGRVKIPHVFPVYHVPAYPSAKSTLDSRASKEIREYWTPLFDRYDVPLAFEYHDHAYKRTPPIKNQRIDPEGTVYIGDGGWGTQVRTPKDPDTTWYLDKTVRARHAVLVSLYRDQRYIMTVDEYGTIIDEYPVLFDRPRNEETVNAVLLPGGGLSISAEYAQRTGPVFIDSDHKGYTGGGFAWFKNGPGPATLKWMVAVQKSGNYKFRFRYSNESDDASLAVLINRKNLPIDHPVKNTGGEASWHESDYTSIYLNSGENVIEIRTTASENLQIDGIEIVPE